jgi:gliding motility-associated-like protein
MKIFTNLFVAFICLTSFLGKAQTISITDPDNGPSNPINCANFDDGSVQNFLDNGGAGNYAPNSKDTITICPDLSAGSKVNVTFATNIGFTFNIDPSDTLYIFDGPDVNSPLLGAINSATNPNGNYYSGSFQNNPTGCLTFVFHSDATNEGTGWGANISCGNPAQPFYPHLEAYINGQGSNVINPLDTGYIDVCLGDSILLVATPDFPYALEVTGTGYSQNVINVTYAWDFSNGTTGANNDSVWFVPTAHTGYYIQLKITDIFPQMEYLTARIRVSQLPSFATTGSLKDTVCINEQTVLIGGVNATDTAGVTIPQGTYEIGGSVAGQTYLPDGTGAQYTTTIPMSGFAPTQTFGAASDIQSVCLNMEHSYLGDIEIWLECPNGTTVPLVNSYLGAGPFSGGFGGGAVYLGDANDNGNGVPGIGWTYCFSSVNNTWGNMATEFAAGNTIPAAGFPPQGGAQSMNPNGVYQPATSFSGFSGCPLNGNWTIHVQDNQGIDDGYIFSWEITFNSVLFPNHETYQNTVDSSFWSPDPTIVSGQNDTLIIVQPGVPGNYSYQFNIVDNFGCPYDTVVQITVKDSIKLNLPSEICTLEYTMTQNLGTNDGVWSTVSGPGNATFDANNVNTKVTFPMFGTYTIVYADTSCTDTDTATIKITEPKPFGFKSDFFLCGGQTTLHLVFADSTGVQSFHWGLLNPAKDTLYQADLAQGTHTVSYTNNLGCHKDTTFTIGFQPKVVLGNYGPVCNDTLIMTNNTGPSGVWSSPNGNGNVSFMTDSINTTVYVKDIGTYTLQYYDSVCDLATSIDVVFSLPPYTQILDTTVCSSEPYQAYALEEKQNDAYLWNTGATGISIPVTESGVYTVKVSNQCGEMSTDADIKVINCDFNLPNVFTPNNDGQNDFFKLLDSAGVNNFNCVITNRWGNPVAEFSNASFTWDGKDKSGKLVDEGVYFYVATAKTLGGKEIKKQGFVHVIRNK